MKTDAGQSDLNSRSVPRDALVMKIFFWMSDLC